MCNDPNYKSQSGYGAPTTRTVWRTPNEDLVFFMIGDDIFKYETSKCAFTKFNDLDGTEETITNDDMENKFYPYLNYFTYIQELQEEMEHAKNEYEKRHGEIQQEINDLQGYKLQPDMGRRLTNCTKLRALHEYVSANFSCL
eukprot:GHVT01041397.1.p1 GENE.GHVT01041397.1~~GHVT01041397.1.p1  ORF type:complete len:142 (+),score=4.53 GHVT01041397.1:631-1056(+)